AAKPEAAALAKQLCDKELPVFIYFENYGVLDSAVYLPRFIQDLGLIPDDSKVRTINAVFTHVGLAPAEIHELGKNRLAPQLLGREPNPTEVAAEQQRKELLAIRLT